MNDAPPAVALRHQLVQADGAALHVAIAGDGPPVILLHGFPENWRSWRHQVPALVHAGFAVWAVDMRGYNLSDRPTDRSAYHLSHLVDDVAAVVHATGCPRTHIGGHDWGGIVAFAFAGRHPALVDKLVIFNAPHVKVYSEKVRRLPQMFRSWYVLFFLLPYLPERALAARHFAAIRHMFTGLRTRPGTFSDRAIEEYVEALSSSGALTAALNYYRANAWSDGVELARSAAIAAETLVIWGERDPALGVELLDGLEQVIPRLRIHRIPDAAHWVQNEAAEEVNRAVVEFLSLL
jgi:pimeloyl-ACP methyl ester carboxylesterase